MAQDGHFDPELAWRQQVAELQTALDLAQAKARPPPPICVRRRHSSPRAHAYQPSCCASRSALTLSSTLLSRQTAQLAGEAAARQEETASLRRQLDAARSGGVAAPSGVSSGGGGDAVTIAKQAERISKLEKKVTEQGEAARQAGQVLLTLRNNLEAESRRSEVAAREAAEARQRAALLEAATAAAEARANSVARESHTEVTKHWKSLDDAQRRVVELTEEVRRLTEVKMDRKTEVRRLLPS